jgi:hypothetical protein
MFWPEIKSHGLRKPDISRKTFFLHSHKFMTGDTTQKLAILISADNAMPLAKYGTAHESGPTAIGPTPT